MTSGATPDGSHGVLDHLSEVAGSLRRRLAQWDRRLGAASAAARRLAMTLLGVLIALATWPIASIQPTAGLDPSWAAGLQMAADRGLDFGRDIVFTYGPLGFLVVPRLFVGWTTVLGLLFALIIQTALALLVLQGLRRSFGTPAAVVVAFAVLAMFPAPGVGMGDRSLLVPAFVGVISIWAAPRLRYRLAVAAGLGALLGFAVLVKFSAVILIPVMLIAVTRGPGPRHRLEGLVALAGGMIAAAVLLWLAAGANPLAIPGWLGDSWGIARGFDGALFLAIPERRWELAPALLAAALCLVAAWRRGGEESRAARLAATAGVLVVLWMLVKQGFVRHDEHSLTFFAGAALLGLVLVHDGRGRTAAVAAATIAAFTGIGAFGLDAATLLRLDRRIPQATRQFADAIQPGRREQIQTEARNAIRTQYPIPPRELARIAESTVHVAPFETAIVWAYGFRWQPLPVFQEYSAYTPGLAARNIDVIAGRDAPEVILVHGGISAPQFTSWPAGTGVAILCRYRAEFANAVLTVLRRRPPLCQGEESASSVTVQPGQPVTIPARRDAAEILAARFVLPRRGFLELLRSLAFRPSKDPPWYELDGREADRLVPATAGELHLLRPAALAGSATIRSPAFEPSSILVRGAGGPVRIEFVRIRTSP